MMMGMRSCRLCQGAMDPMARDVAHPVQYAIPSAFTHPTALTPLLAAVLLIESN